MKPRLAAGAALSLFVVACGSSEQSSAPPPVQDDARAEIPAQVQRQMHSRLHALGRICGRKVRSAAVERTARAFLGYRRRYPPERYSFRLHDERATSFSALLVLRNRLRRCSPKWTRAIDAALPARVRRALRPPVAG